MRDGDLRWRIVRARRPSLHGLTRWFSRLCRRFYVNVILSGGFALLNPRLLTQSSLVELKVYFADATRPSDDVRARRPSLHGLTRDVMV